MLQWRNFLSNTLRYLEDILSEENAPRINAYEKKKTLEAYFRLHNVDLRPRIFYLVAYLFFFPSSKMWWSALHLINQNPVIFLVFI